MTKRSPQNATEHIIRRLTYNHQHLESYSIGNYFYVNYVISNLQLPIHVACWLASLQDM